MNDAIVARFRQARRDPSLTVLEGFHALKHALRFGARVVEAVASDPAELEQLAHALAPDLEGSLSGLVHRVGPEVLAEAAPHAPRTGVIAIAHRPVVDVAAALGDHRSAPVVLLEDPRNMGNLGACIRVAAAADATAVLTTGHNDPWHPDAVRGAAGLQYALPVARIAELPRGDRPLIAVDPAGEEMHATVLPRRAVLAFGAERYGLSSGLRARADATIRIPMRAGVSSLNLATSVAAVLYSWRILREEARRAHGPVDEGCSD